MANLSLKPIVLLLLITGGACGPSIGTDSDEDSGQEPSADAADACGEGSCPPEILCGDEQRVCDSALGIGECIDGKCGPTPTGCMVESTPEHTCAEFCDSQGMSCVENGCEGATAFGYPGPQSAVIQMCGENGQDLREFVTDLSISCDQQLEFVPGGESISVYQCCCDDPNR